MSEIINESFDSECPVCQVVVPYDSKCVNSWRCDNCGKENHEPNKGGNCWCISCDNNDCGKVYDSGEYSECPQCEHR